jgi:hypothetical protein
MKGELRARFGTLGGNGIRSGVQGEIKRQKTPSQQEGARARGRKEKKENRGAARSCSALSTLAPYLLLLQYA